MAHGENKSLKLNMILNGIKGVMGIIFPLISFPYVSSVLGIEGLGKFNFASSVISYFSLIAALGISIYAVREGARVRDSEEAFSAFASQVYSINIISTALSFVLLLIMLCAVPMFASYRVLIAILYVSVLFQTFGCDWVYSVYEEFLFITIRSIVFQVISIALLFLLVKTPDDLNVYTYISTLAAVGSNILNRIRAHKYGRIRLTTHIDWKKHLKPIVLLFAMNAAVTLYVSSDVTILGILCGDYTVGIYAVSVKVYNMVKTVLSAVVVVSIPRLSALWGQKDQDGFRSTASDIYATLITIILPTITGLILLSKEVVLILSDEQYLEAIPSLIILSISLFFCLGAGFWGQAILIPIGREKTVVEVTIISAIVNICLNFVLIPLWGEVAAALTTLLSEMLSFLLCAASVRNTVKLTGFVTAFFKTVVGCLAMSCFVLALGKLHMGMLLYTILAVAGSVVIYFVVELLLKNSAVWGLVSDIRRR